MIKKINMMIYGQPSSGKTKLINSLDNTEHVKKAVMFDFDRNAHMMVKSPKITVESPTSLDSIELFCETLKSNPSKLKDIDTIIIDTVTEMSSLSLDEVALESYKISRDGKRKSEDRLEIKDYGVNTKRITRICRTIKNSDKNVIFMGHAKTIENEDETLRFVPRLSGELCTAILGFMNFVFYLHQDKGKRILITKESEKVHARSQGVCGEKLDKMIENPDLGEIFNKIFELENTNG